MSDFERYRRQRQRYERKKALAVDELAIEIENSMETHGVAQAIHESAEQGRDDMAICFARMRLENRGRYDKEVLDDVEQQLRDAALRPDGNPFLKRAIREDRGHVGALFESYAERPPGLRERVEEALARPQSFGERVATDPDAQDREL